MTTINETQRKYLRKRMDEVAASKRRQIHESFTPLQIEWPGGSKVAYIEAKLLEAGLTWKVDKYTANSVWTDLDEERQASFDELEKAKQAKLREFNDVVNKALDDLILGSDSDEIRLVLQRLIDFN